ncbi:hypothetical protein EVAR_83897_1 [Eumeta japonica]|uniref:Uncharacterized protein n=1 Tax=Eumeta variegata TaxID=151549 RepID=A0A4C1USJ0_EUMVA|nr:hypothetical protein EVAR_83897_1 [Eumeta japonica]
MPNAFDTQNDIELLTNNARTRREHATDAGAGDLNKTLATGSGRITSQRGDGAQEEVVTGASRIDLRGGAPGHYFHAVPASPPRAP